jgi:SpoIID/LytB domain protein
LADELSGADKLRVVYSNQFAWTKENLPLITVRVAEGRDHVTIAAVGGGGIRLYPDGDGGAEVRGGNTWSVAVDSGHPARIRYHVVVARLPVAGPTPIADRLPIELKRWRDAGYRPRTFELGALFGVHGEVLDSRRIVVTISEQDNEPAAKKEAARLQQKHAVETSVFPELAERPRGVVEGTDEHGLAVRNDGILWFSPADPHGLLEVKDVDKESGGREARRYFGRLYVTVDAGGKLAVVNAVPEDKLLSGLVPAEMMPSAPPEALKAQAIAARNELLAKVGTRHLTDPYRLCSTQHCQVYAGAGREDPRSTAAVQATRGEILERDGGRESAEAGLVDAVYSASCGGHTEDNDLGWGGAPDSSLRGDLDADTAVKLHLSAFATIGENEVRTWLRAPDEAARPYCARPRGAAASFRWTTKIDLQQAAARAQVGPLKEIQVTARGVSGRVVRMKLVGDIGAKEVRGELEVRRALGGLKSALFALDLTRDASGHLESATAIGGGHGHGIGMCQLGAVGMAEAGATYAEILKHYYRSAHLRHLY